MPWTPPSPISYWTHYRGFFFCGGGEQIGLLLSTVQETQKEFVNFEIVLKIFKNCLHFYGKNISSIFSWNLCFLALVTHWFLSWKQKAFTTSVWLARKGVDGILNRATGVSSVCNYASCTQACTWNTLDLPTSSWWCSSSQHCQVPSACVWNVSKQCRGLCGYLDDEYLDLPTNFCCFINGIWVEV